MYWKIITFLVLPLLSYAQPERWQQRVYYDMDIDFDVEKHQFDGFQTLVYQNNSPDTLRKVFYHLYFNAFQPGSMMDVRNRTIEDPEYKIGERIVALKPNEIGFHKILELKMNGSPTAYSAEGTILEVSLPEPILPRSSAVFEMKFKAQVPVQIRRSGRNNKEGIDYSMSQWYPKLCEYDYQGWHANPYVGREFYGVWGDFDVTISIDKKYILGGTGYLQNANEIGYGYEDPGTKVKKTKSKKLSWHFFAPNVHDFMWAADRDYTHDVLRRDDGLTLHFLYQKGERTTENWLKLPEVMSKSFDYINETFGPYPYKQYSFIQGGDGGMEYPMGTLITGERNYSSLVGVSIHELMHSWYQMMMGSNEALYAWQDEGFTVFATVKTVNHLKKLGLYSGKYEEFPQSYGNYYHLVRSGKEEPMTVHADHFKSNYAYGQAAYSKGNVFISQLEYIMGRKAFDQGMLDYYETWKYKHPNPNDFIRVMENASDLELDWYREHWINTTNTIDYGIEEVTASENNTLVSLKRVNVMPMPLDIVVELKNGNQIWYNIPLRIMRGQKNKEEFMVGSFVVLEDWPWTHPVYEFSIPFNKEEIKSVTIDPTERLADVNKDNDEWIQRKASQK